MNMKLDKSVVIPISLCDRDGKLSYPAHFSVFMDMASEHGPQIGLGLDDPAMKDLFWLTVKTKIRVYDRPNMLRQVNVSTWPEKPGRVRTNRLYTIKDGDNLLAEGKTEWALINTVTGKLVRFDSVYPKDLVHIDAPVSVSPFSKISEDFDEDQCIGSYTVCATDIDIGQHMNNAAYLRALFGMLTNDLLKGRDIFEMEAVFKTPCYEGEVLKVYCREEGGMQLAMKKPDGTTALVAGITFK